MTSWLENVHGFSLENLQLHEGKTFFGLEYTYRHHWQVCILQASTWVNEVRNSETERKVTDTMLDPFLLTPSKHGMPWHSQPCISGCTALPGDQSLKSSDDTAILPSYHVLASLSLSLYITITTMIKLKKTHNDPISCGHPHTFASTRSSCCASMLWCQLQHQGTAPWRNMKKSTKKKTLKNWFKKKTSQLRRLGHPYSCANSATWLPCFQA